MTKTKQYNLQKHTWTGEDHIPARHAKHDIAKNMIL